MKKYFINILLFFIIVVAIDVLYGVALQYMNNHAKGGAIGNRYYVCKKSNDDVLIFGSTMLVRMVMVSYLVMDT